MEYSLAQPLRYSRAVVTEVNHTSFGSTVADYTNGDLYVQGVFAIGGFAGVRDELLDDFGEECSIDIGQASALFGGQRETVWRKLLA